MRPLKKTNESIHLQDRDLIILRGLFESRVMTAAHISALYFGRRAEAAKKRLQKLKIAQFIAERPRKAFAPAVLFLTHNALDILHERGILHEYPAFDLASLKRRTRVSDITLRHELAVMDVKTSFCFATTKTATISVIEFTTWPLLNQFEAAGTLVKPDGFIHIQEKTRDGGIREHCFFLEVDRSTEVQEILAHRAALYVDYYKSGGFAKRRGAPQSAFKKHPGLASKKWTPIQATLMSFSCCLFSKATGEI